MNKKRVFIGLIIAAVVIALYYYLKGDGQATQVSYPNTQASGVPASQNPASTWNIQTPQIGPSPAAIYAPAPTLPATPGLQYFNYAPLNIYQITPEAATAAPVGGKPVLPGGVAALPGGGVAIAGTSPVAGATGSDCGCGGSCGGSCSPCQSCPTGGTYLDGNQASCLASNPVQQATAPSGSVVWTAANLQSFFGPVQ